MDLGRLFLNLGFWYQSIRPRELVILGSLAGYVARIQWGGVPHTLESVHIILVRKALKLPKLK